MASSTASTSIGEAGSAWTAAQRRVDALGELLAHARTSAKSRSSEPAARSHSSRVGHHRHPHVALALRSEERPGRDDDVRAIQQLERPGQRRAFARDRDPQVEGCLAARDVHAVPREQVEEHRPLGRVPRPVLLDVALVAPGRDARALDELLRGDADRRAEPLQRGDQGRVAGREAAAVAGHRRALAQRVEHHHVGEVAAAAARRAAARRRTTARCRPRRRRAARRARGIARPPRPGTTAAPPRRSGCSDSSATAALARAHCSSVIAPRSGRKPRSSVRRRRWTSPPAYRAPRSGIG